MTLPIGDTFDAALQEAIQGGRIYVESGLVVHPFYECCLSGTSVGVTKSTVPRAIVYPLQACVDQNIYCNYVDSYSPIGTLTYYQITWSDAHISDGGWPGLGYRNHPFASVGNKWLRLMVRDDSVPALDSYIDVEFKVVDCTTYPATTLVAVINNSGIWKTEDGGLTWAQVFVSPTGTSYGISADPFTYTQTERTIFAAMYTDGLWKSVDSGDTWQQVTYPYSPYAVKFSKVVRNKLYVLGNNAGSIVLSRSADGGATWTHSATGHTYLGGLRVRELAVTFNDQYVFYIADNGADVDVWRADEDLTNPTLVHTFATISAAIVVTAQDDRVYIMAIGGLLVSEDWGATWTNIVVTTGVRDLAVSVRDSRHLVRVNTIAGAYHSYVSYDHGITWLDCGVVANARVITIDPVDENVLYLGCTSTADTVMVSVWNGIGAFARDTGLPAQQVMEIEVL